MLPNGLGNAQSGPDCGRKSGEFSAGPHPLLPTQASCTDVPTERETTGATLFLPPNVGTDPNVEASSFQIVSEVSASSGNRPHPLLRQGQLLRRSRPPPAAVVEELSEVRGGATLLARRSDSPREEEEDIEEERLSSRGGALRSAACSSTPTDGTTLTDGTTSGDVASLSSASFSSSSTELGFTELCGARAGARHLGLSPLSFFRVEGEPDQFSDSSWSSGSAGSDEEARSSDADLPEDDKGIRVFFPADVDRGPQNLPEEEQRRAQTLNQLPPQDRSAPAAEDHSPTSNLSPEELSEHFYLEQQIVRYNRIKHRAENNIASLTTILEDRRLKQRSPSRKNSVSPHAAFRRASTGTGRGELESVSSPLRFHRDFGCLSAETETDPRGGLSAEAEADLTYRQVRPR